MGRSPCCDKNGGPLKKGPWSPEEDLKLTTYIQAHGPGNWRTIPKNAGLQRCGKSCRLRWTNYLRPDIKRGRFSFEEEETIIQLHSSLGNKWSAIAARLPGRTDNEIKNYWNTHIRKRLLKSGIDPVTHAPRLDISPLLNFTHQLNLSNMLRLFTTLMPVLDETNPLLLFQNHHLLFQKLLQENQALLMNNEPPVEPHPQYTMNAAAADLNSVQEHLVPSNCGYFGAAGNDQSLIGEMWNDNQNGQQGFGLDSVLSTPLSSSPASTAFVNGGSCTEDDKESDCSNIMKFFEIPSSSLDLEDLLQ